MITFKNCNFAYLIAVGAFLSPFSAVADDLTIIPTVRQTESKGIGYRHGYTSLELFFAPDGEVDMVVPFVDLRGHHFDNGRYAANVGVGARYYSCDLNEVFGANFYYDYRDGERHDRGGEFNQIGLGLEMLGPCLNYRVNGYLPIGRQTSCPTVTVFDNFVGNYRLFRTQERITMGGFDAEIEALVYRLGCWRFFVAAGPYYLRDMKSFRGQHDSLVGGQFRITADFNQYISAEFFVTTDRIYNTRAQGRISISFPLEYQVCKRSDDCCEEDKCCLFDRLFGQPIRRHEIIPLDTQCCWRSNF